MKRVRWAVTAVLVFGASGCSIVHAVGPCPRNLTCVNGSAVFVGIEGGFWAIRGDDSVTYDPIGGLPSDFQQSGLRVHLQARERHDLLSLHQVGPLVEIVALRRID